MKASVPYHIPSAFRLYLPRSSWASLGIWGTPNGFHYVGVKVIIPNSILCTDLSVARIPRSLELKLTLNAFRICLVDALFDCILYSKSE
jgi:hypothetical protein